LNPFASLIHLNRWIRNYAGIIERIITLGKILVTGASGVIGKHTLLHLLKRKQADQLVGLVRDLAKAEDLVATGIELRQGDYLDPASLAMAFKDVDKLMLTATHAFTDRKTAHTNVIDAAVNAGVKHIVYMPISRKKNSTLVMKEITEEDAFTVEKIVASGLNYTFAEHPPFMDNIHFYIGQKAPETGVFVTEGKGKFTSATREDLAEAHAVILSSDGHDKKTYRLTGTPAVSFAEIAKFFSEAQGKEVPYIPVSDAEYTKVKLAEGWPDFIVDFAKGWVNGMNDGEWAEVTDEYEKLVGHKPKSPSEFFRNDFFTQKY
jgi:NAD(P)H dehydrogenase (quinone)